MVASGIIDHMSKTKRGPGRPPKETTPEENKDRHKPHRMMRVPLPLYHRLKQVAETNDRDEHRELRRALIAHLEAEEKRLGITPPEDADGD